MRTPLPRLFGFFAILSTALARGQGGCIPPTATIAGAENGTLRGCIGLMTLDGSGSAAAEGHSIVGYAWSSGGASIGSTPTVQQDFATGNAYPLVLTVTDDIGCAASDSVVLLIAPAPILDIMPATTWTCEDDLEFTATPIASFLSIGSDSATLIPDNSLPISFTLVFDQFGEDSTLQSVNDIGPVCLDLEHSFMGDLVITLVAPGGQSVVLHQQGGGGTFLGLPIDDSGPGDTPGSCFLYCFSPTASNGTWEENSGGAVLPSGTYESVGSFDQLLGSTLDGAWTLTFIDLWGNDNGWLCDWSLTLGGHTVSSATSTNHTIAPTFGVDCDSTFWSGPPLGSLSADCETVSILDAPSGSYVYTYTVLDNYGCTYNWYHTVTLAPLLDPEILGDATPMPGETTTYTTTATGGTYNWSVWGGSLISPQGGASMDVQWIEPTGGWVMLHYTQSDCEASTIFPVQSSVGLNEAAVEVATIFPNPADQRLNITLTEPVGTFRIHDALGRTIDTEIENMAPGLCSIDTSYLPNGTYFLHLATENGRQVQRFVVQH